MLQLMHKPLWLFFLLAWPGHPAWGQSQSLGDWQVDWQDTTQQIQMRRGERQWQTSPGVPLVQVAQGHWEAHEQRGSFALRREIAPCPASPLELSLRTADQWRWQSRLGAPCAGLLVLSLRPSGADLQLGVELHRRTQKTQATQITLNMARPSAELYGLGQQFSHLALPAAEIPLISQENGIGRGDQPLSALIDAASPGSAGHAFSSYAPAPHLLDAFGHGLAWDSVAPAVVDLRQGIQVHLATSQAAFYLTGQPRALDAISQYTARFGRMQPLPNWVHQGAIVGMQGGSAQVRKVWKQLKAQGTPISAFWLQDWVGRRRTVIGSQLWWNWEIDRVRYPDWEALVAELKADGVRVLGYINPFLVDANPKGTVQRNLFQEAKTKGYLVQHPEGGIYPVKNTDFDAGLVDLSNPEARTWLKGVIRDQLLASGLSGWMADYGEALPWDAALHSGESAPDWHNRYPIEWAKLNREALADHPETVFFSRSGYGTAPHATDLFWTGDQLVDWSPHDGLPSSLKAILSGGLSGMALNHSDAGGYTSAAWNGFGWLRTRKLLARWLELNAFTPVLRTHEGNQPEQNSQIYTSAQHLATFDRAARIFAALFPYRQALMQEHAATGWPLLRPLWLHYPHDAVARTCQDQFLLGENLLVAPMLTPQPLWQLRRLYLPAGQWQHVWSGKVYGHRWRGSWVEVAAPEGSPPAFWRMEAGPAPFNMP